MTTLPYLRKQMDDYPASDTLYTFSANELVVGKNMLKVELPIHSGAATEFLALRSWNAVVTKKIKRRYIKEGEGN